MKTWTPLWNTLVDSTVWDLPLHAFKIFMGMLSIKDHNHVVSLDGWKLARRLHMDVEVVLDALKILSAPDPSHPEQEFEGRRIKPVEDGWLVLNGSKYQEMMRLEMKRARNRRGQAAYRERKKAKDKSDYQVDKREDPEGHVMQGEKGMIAEAPF